MQFFLILIVAAIIGAVIGAWGFWITLVGGLLLAGYWGGIRLNREQRERRDHHVHRDHQRKRRR